LEALITLVAAVVALISIILIFPNCAKKICRGVEAGLKKPLPTATITRLDDKLDEVVQHR